MRSYINTLRVSNIEKKDAVTTENCFLNEGDFKCVRCNYENKIFFSDHEWRGHEYQELSTKCENCKTLYDIYVEVMHCGELNMIATAEEPIVVNSYPVIRRVRREKDIGGKELQKEVNKIKKEKGVIMCNKKRYSRKLEKFVDVFSYNHLKGEEDLLMEVEEWYSTTKEVFLSMDELTSKDLKYDNHQEMIEDIHFMATHPNMFGDVHHSEILKDDLLIPGIEMSYIHDIIIPKGGIVL